jgi:putative oxidoreductase
MERLLGRYSPRAFALLRIFAGLMFMMHGTQKLFGWPGGEKVAHGSLMGLAGVIEVVCGALILIGLFGSIAAFIASGEMAAAYFMAHAGQGFWPIQNRGELAVLYCFLFLYVAAHGSGVWSVDALRGRTWAEKVTPLRPTRVA